MKWQPYTEYEESETGWLGRIPRFWKTIPLWCLYNRKSEKGCSDLPLLSVYRDYGVIPTDSRDDNYNKPSLDLSGYLHIKPTDLVTNKMKTWQGSIAISNYEGIVSPAYYTCRATHKEYHRYIHYLLRCEKYTSIYMTLSKGIRVNQWDLDYEYFRNIPILLPSNNEQRAIATFLDRETERIDNLISKKQQQIELLQEKRSALISHVVTKGLNPNVKMKDSGVEWLGQIPEHWEITRIKYIGKIKYGLGEPPQFLDNGLPIIRATDIYNGKIIMDNVQFVDPNDIPWSRDPILRKDDIIVVRSGAYTGDSAIVDSEVAGAITGYDMVLRVKKAIPHFVAYVLLSKYIVQGQIYLEKMRAAQPHLNAEEFGNCIILLPPKDEQLNVVTFLRSELLKIDNITNKIGESIEKLKEYRSALISAVVTGKIDVSQEVA
ncbi:MAG: restriction endonuclease subunit S [Dehalococcoidales bacterium]|nr:restriction endonuclease subunit S [Dehalococcoidales bacterium]